MNLQGENRAQQFFYSVSLASRIRCHQMDDFGPAKNLMTMCFTYYHVGKAQGRGGRGAKRGDPRLVNL